MADDLGLPRFLHYLVDGGYIAVPDWLGVVALGNEAIHGTGKAQVREHAASVECGGNAAERVASDIRDNIPVVEFREGTDAPQKCDWQEVLYNVQRGFVYTGTGQVCYRRTAAPDWSDGPLTRWSCVHYLVSGSKTYSLH